MLRWPTFPSRSCKLLTNFHPSEEVLAIKCLERSEAILSLSSCTAVWSGLHNSVHIHHGTSSPGGMEMPGKAPDKEFMLKGLDTAMPGAKMGTWGNSNEGAESRLPGWAAWRAD